MGNSLAGSKKHHKKNKEPKVVLFGLSNSGKSTLLYRMKLGETIETFHNSSTTVEELQGQRFLLSVWDVGLRHRERVFLRFNLFHTDVIVYVIDSTDRERFEEAKDEIHDVMFEKDVRTIPLLILANKQDLPGSLGPNEITKELKLDRKMQRRFAVLPVCATSGEGLETAFNWVEDAIAIQSGMELVDSNHGLQDDDSTPEEKVAEKPSVSAKWTKKGIFSSAVMFTKSLLRGRSS